MLDIKFIRENKDIVQEGARKKRIAFNVDDLLKVDDRRRELMTAIEKKRAEQNQWSEKIAGTPDAAAKAQLIAEMKIVKDELQKEEEEQKEVMKNWQALMVQVPNIPDMSVPEGDSDADNQEVKVWGEIPKFNFAPKSHIEIMEKASMVDLEKGAKISGFRGYFLKNDAVLLSFAIWQFVSDHFNFKGDFSQMLVPSLVRRETLVGTGYLPQGEEDMYKTQDNDYLAGTAEVATMSYFADDVLNLGDLPKKIIAFSPSFRREAGSHGKDTKGIMRVHEFFKFEQVILCEASHEESVKRHEELLNNAEEIMQALKIPYRIVVNCSGDLGLGQVKKYDIEAWVPSENRYRETHSCSYFHDFQTRRLNIRYKDKDGKLRFAHSLNNTAIATPRILISIIENNQREDGSVSVPEVLQKYIGKETISRKI
ncbi:MAG: serine--tRNA ligase [Patescibacteria group bacterium]|nr:serine--tRNA ligase [Patescibacteria group bacterium]MDE1988407.1 serine--tRNA ligase [Patescibacteria group bacterium]MDE2217859.1 serine--tRNA ligase [Patescibacteria group bacterium]